VNKIAINVGKYVGATLDKQMEQRIAGMSKEFLMGDKVFEELALAVKQEQARCKMLDLGTYLEEKMYANN